MSAPGRRPAGWADRLAWFQDLKLGLFLHWGVYAQWDCCESWPLVPADTWARPDDLRCWVERGRDLERFTRDYRALHRTFDPRRFDPAAWARVARRAGMRYVTFTAKHHDGFCLWDTATTNYKTTGSDCPFGTDAVAAVFEAFRAEGLGIACYLSKPDWHCSDYWDPARPVVDRNPNYDPRAEPERWARFVDLTHRQVEELTTRYGAIDVLWLDGGWVRPPVQDLRMADLVARARRHQPGLLVADRTVGGAFEDFTTPEQTVPDEPPDGAWESCVTLGGSWKYVEHDVFKPLPELLRLLVEVVAKGGNLLLGVGPDPDGALPEAALDRLAALGAWMDDNGEAIHGTRPLATWREGMTCFTRRDDTVYAIVREAPADGGVVLTSVLPPRGAGVACLGHEGPVRVDRTPGGVVVRLPVAACDRLETGVPVVLRFDAKGAAGGQPVEAPTPPAGSPKGC